MRHRIGLLVLVCCLAAVPARGQIRADVYVGGLTNPVAFVQDPSNPAVQFIVEQGGRIRVVMNGALQAADFLDLSAVVSTAAEHGLLGLAFPPDAGATGRFYVNFTNAAGDTVVSRFRRSAVDPLVADVATRVDLLWPGGQRFIAQPFANHNGGNLVFGPDGYLYIGLGDGGDGNDLAIAPRIPAACSARCCASTWRSATAIRPGTRAARQPFPRHARRAARDLGLRAAQSLALQLRRSAPRRHRRAGRGDVGQAAWEEVDYEPAGRGGRNYGWRNREGAHDNVTASLRRFCR